MKKKWIRKEDCFAFLLPLIAMLIIFIGKGIFPFGKESFLRTDLYHQYAPFLRAFQAKLQSLGTFSYSFDVGLGVNFRALQAYYLASPLNFFVLFFPKTLVVEYITYLIVLKIALSGLSASVYFRKHFRRNDYAATLFGMLYALSGYIAAYSWNVMWLDCIALFPLILLGLEILMEKGNPILYTLSLALSILSNYYISIMICLFLFFYFVALLFYHVRKSLGDECCISLYILFWQDSWLRSFFCRLFLPCVLPPLPVFPFRLLLCSISPLWIWRPDCFLLWKRSRDWNIGPIFMRGHFPFSFCLCILKILQFNGRRNVFLPFFCFSSF